MFALVDGNSFYASCEQVFDLDAARRPVVVLSNNDGCVIAASAEAKALGCKMFKPYFQIKNDLAGHNVKVFSSNYALYHDFQQRLVALYREHAEEVEVYSIDEAFLTLGDLGTDALLAWGDALKRKTKQWTGIPVGIGIAKTKMLAKLANHAAKRDPVPGMPEGVCVLNDAATLDRVLDRVQLSDLWGINRGSIARLATLGITTPRQMQNADPTRVRDVLGVVGQRQVYELRGVSCLPLETAPPDKKNVCCSRSFGNVTGCLDQLTEAVTTFATHAAAKLRRQGLATTDITAFIQTDRHAEVQQYAASWSAKLTVASDDTREIAAAAAACVRRVFRPQHQYKKAGVMLGHLVKRAARQPGLFDTRDHEKTHRLMTALDTINQRQGRNAVRLGSASPMQLNPCRTWHLKSNHRSPRWTTAWDELPVARALREGGHR